MEFPSPKVSSSQRWLPHLTAAVLLVFSLTFFINQRWDDRPVLFTSMPTLRLPLIVETSGIPLQSTVVQVDAESRPEQYSVGVGAEACDIYDGRWVYDPQAYPLYGSSQCPFLDAEVSCRRNGRPDSDYEHWRWEPSGCRIPRFNGTWVLEMMRGKRVVIVGDSLNRNMWESLSCMLYSSVPTSRAVVDVSRSDHKVFHAKDYNCTVEFYWSPFLVKLDKQAGKKTVLKLDEVPDSAGRWREADVLVFNSAHWWTHTGRFRSWDVFERNGEQVEDMGRDEAFQHGMETWARWVDTHMNPSKTTVFFRSYSPEHKGESWCYNQTRPMATTEAYTRRFPAAMREIVEAAIAGMSTPVKYLDITRLSEYRREAHSSVYTGLARPELKEDPRSHADCSHWCLPGVPDTWNALLFASLFRKSGAVIH